MKGGREDEDTDYLFRDTDFMRKACRKEKRSTGRRDHRPLPLVIRPWITSCPLSMSTKAEI